MYLDSVGGGGSIQMRSELRTHSRPTGKSKANDRNKEGRREIKVKKKKLIVTTRDKPRGRYACVAFSIVGQHGQARGAGQTD